MGHRARRTRSIALGWTFVAVASFIAWTATPANATVYANTTSLSINGGLMGPASLYPSPIGVPSGGIVVDVNVTLWGISAISTQNIDALLVSPGGTSVVLMADTDALPQFPTQSIDLTFDDAAATSLPASAAATGSYKPTNLGAFSDTARPGPYGSLLSDFNGAPAGGSWKLYVWNDGSNTVNFGTITGGWSLDIATLRITAFAPAAGPVGSVVTLAGSGFTGAKAVLFGGVASTTFTVITDTTMTAVVPAGATTGSISVVTLDGTALSETEFTVAAQGIASITPAAGLVGSEVTIAGSGFTGTTAVSFKQTAAAAFTVDSNTQITATVPPGASTGKVTVVTPSGTLVSPRAFVVRHRRAVSIERNGARVDGRVDVEDSFDVCGASVPIKVQHRVGGRWVTVARIKTKTDGSFTTAGLGDPGSYRAVAKKTKLPSGDVCLKARSSTD